MEHELQVGSNAWFEQPRDSRWAAKQFALIRDTIANNYYTVREAFEAFDRDHDGFLTIDDIAIGLGMLGLFMSGDDMVSTFKALDEQRRYKVSFAEFTSRIRSSKATIYGDRSGIEVPDAVVNAILQLIDDNRVSVLNICRDFDTHRNGWISKSELRFALQRIQVGGPFGLSNAVLDALLKAVTPRQKRGEGRMTDSKIFFTDFLARVQQLIKARRMQTPDIMPSQVVHQGQTQQRDGDGAAQGNETAERGATEGPQEPQPESTASSESTGPDQQERSDVATSTTTAQDDGNGEDDAQGHIQPAVAHTSPHETLSPAQTETSTVLSDSAEIEVMLDLSPVRTQPIRALSSHDTETNISTDIQQ